MLVPRYEHSNADRAVVAGTSRSAMPFTGGNGSCDCAVAFNRSGHLGACAAVRPGGVGDAAALEDAELDDVKELFDTTTPGVVADFDAAEDTGTATPAVGDPTC